MCDPKARRTHRASARGARFRARAGYPERNRPSATFEMPAGSTNGRITYERLWSSAGAPPADVAVVRRAEVGRVLTATGYGFAALGGALVGFPFGIAVSYLAVQVFSSETQILAVAANVAVYGCWIAVGCGLAYGFLRRELPVVTRPRLSYLGDVVGPGVQLTVGTK